MKEVPINRLEEVLSGRMITNVKDGTINDIVIDSRKAGPGKIFIPLQGQHYDAHDFIKEAIDNGCNAVVSEKTPQALGLDIDELNKNKVAFIITGSTIRAMRRLAAFNRDRVGIPVIAVTGSSGKTTTKDLIASVLSQKFKVHKTQENLNNVYGVPQSVIGIDADDEVAVIEMGMDHEGEIEQSIRFVKPQIAVITNIGTAHLEKLGSPENILKAKMEVLKTLSDKDTAILNGDDENLNKIDPTPFKIMRYGIYDENLNLKANNIVSDTEGVHFDIGIEHYDFSYPGEHNVYNVLVAIGIGKMFGLSQQEIQNGLDAYLPSDHRQNIIKLKDSDITLIDDSYNANPESMKAALRALRSYVGKDSDRRCIAVLGDMFELGDSSLTGHLNVGREAARQADFLIGIGEHSKNIIRGAIDVRAGMRGQYFKFNHEAAKFLIENLQPGDVVLFKASRGMHFDEIVEQIKNKKS